MTKEELAKKVDDFVEMLEKENIKCYVACESAIYRQLGYARATFKPTELIGIMEASKHMELNKLIFNEHKKCSEDALKKAVESMEKNPDLVKRMVDAQRDVE